MRFASGKLPGKNAEMKTVGHLPWKDNLCSVTMETELAQLEKKMK